MKHVTTFCTMYILFNIKMFYIKMSNEHTIVDIEQSLIQSFVYFKSNQIEHTRNREYTQISIQAIINSNENVQELYFGLLME